MMPLPAHLREIAVPIGALHDENSVIAKLKCPCRSEQFQLLYSGLTWKDGDEVKPQGVKVGDNFFVVLKARCCACVRDHLLFDWHRHGWSGFVGEMWKRATAPCP